MQAALPVDEDSVDVRLILQRMREGLPPADVQEYLWRVRIEADGIPDVVVSDVDPRKYDTEQTANMPAVVDFGDTVDPSVLPNNQWKQTLLADFADLRQLLSRWQEIGVPPTEKEGPIPKSVLRTQVPRMNDEEGWIKFFFGKPTGSDDDANRTTMKVETDLTQYGTPPHLRLLLQFDQVITRRLLQYHMDWLNAIEYLSRARAVWIYALLARLDKPVHSDTAAILRQILRRCWQMRNELNDPKQSSLRSLNILIAITGDFFQQLHDV